MCKIYEYNNRLIWPVGCRQGEILSPVLFTLFIKEIEVTLHDNTNAGVNLYELSLFLLLFADKTVLLSQPV